MLGEQCLKNKDYVIVCTNCWQVSGYSQSKSFAASKMTNVKSGNTFLIRYYLI